MNKLTLKATAIGSLPHKNAQDAIDLIFDKFKSAPFWPQLAKVDKHEEMTVQYLQNIPGIKFDDRLGKYIYDSQSDEFFMDLEEFFVDFETIVVEKDFSNLEKYAICAPNSSSINLFLDKLTTSDYEYAKGHIVGPFTLGTSLCDYENVCAFYDETYREVLTKGLILKAIWQIQKIKECAPDTKPIIFIDEPVMSQLGTSAFLTVKRNAVVDVLKEVSDTIKDFGAISAIHCCGKADWSVLIDAGINVINFDAYAYTKSLSTHAKEITEFVGNGGYIAWGLVPTLDKVALAQTTVEELEEKFENAVDDLVKKTSNKLLRETIIKHSFFTPSCGAGSLTVSLAEKAMVLVNELSDKFREKYNY